MNKEYLNEIKLIMPKTESDRNDGINDGNIETYKNRRMLSLTKEELQNSTDGAINKNQKVIVEFNDFYLSKSNFPDYEKTIKVLEEEKEYWNDFLENDKKTVEFLDSALGILKKDNIRCLRISDFNTTGLTGIKGKSTPWQNLVKNRGVSDKPGYAGGSFGIGKDAAFSCSQLRTVFYNTMNIEEEEAFQGVLKLPSYQKDDICYDGFGFYCLDTNDKKINPILKSYSLDNSYTRTEKGMDKFIIGFDDSYAKEDLRKDVISSSINNFLFAFFSDKLEVRYGDVIVNKDTLDEIFNEYSENGIDVLTKEYYETLKNPQKIIYATIFEEDDIKIYLRLDANASRKAAIVRQSGMKVFDKTHLSGRIGFSAVVILTGDAANGYFKKLENAEHTQWSDDRADDSKDAKAKANIIYNTIREAISELHKNEYAELIDADGLNEYLPLAYVTGKKDKKEALSNEVIKKEKAPKKNNKTRPEKKEEEIKYEKDENGDIIESTIRIGDEDDGPNPVPNPFPGDIHNPDTDGDETVSPTDTGEFSTKRKMSEANMTYTLLSTQNGYKLKFKSLENIELGYFEIQISGEQDSMSVNVKNASINGLFVKIRKNKILLNNIIKDTKYELFFELDQSLKFALEVIAYESKK